MTNYDTESIHNSMGHGGSLDLPAPRRAGHDYLPGVGVHIQRAPFQVGKGPGKGPKPLLIKSIVRLPAFEYHQHIPRQEYRITVRNDFLFTPLNQQDQSVGI